MSAPSFANNRICQLFGIRYPLVQAGMVWASGWRLASAVSNAGGLGLIGAGSMRPEVLRQHILQCQAATHKPFGVNVPLLYPQIEAIMALIVQMGVKIVFTSAGNPRTYTAYLKDAGITVVHVVPGAKYAEKAAAAAVDAIVCEGFEAGGHNGREETTTLCLVPQVRQATHLPLLAAGGIATGAAWLAVTALGAEGAQVGTRFAATQEASLHPAFKARITQTPEDGTMLALKAITPTRMLKNEFYQLVQAAEARGAAVEELRTLLGTGRAKRGMFEGDLENGELEIGQVAALVREVLPAGEVVARLVAEYGEALARLA